MKATLFKNIFFLLSISVHMTLNASAFTPHINRSTTRLSPFSYVIMMVRPDSSQEIQEALRKSKEFGIDSKEARVAWDIVEEIDASDNIRYVGYIILST
jgi:hypothetical protein